MTTKRERLALFRPLLARNADLVSVEGDFGTRIVVLKPVSHFLAGIQIDATSSKEQFRVYIYFSILFDINTYFVTFIQDEIYRKNHRSPTHSLWLIGDEFVEEDFIEVVERDALPRLRALTTFGAVRAFFDWAPSLWTGPGPTRLGLLALASGDFDEAKQIFDRWRSLRLFDDLNRLGNGLAERICADGSKLAANDRMLLSQILHDCEESRVQRLGVQDIWQRTPFPLEEMSG